MTASQSLVHNKLKAAMALLLTFVAGFVDIVSYLAVYLLFTANMTGTTEHLGYDLVTGKPGAAMIALSVLASFLLGSVGGRALILRWASKPQVLPGSVHSRCTPRL
jgi:uncharacterized membrane protein YoaK (UPF0700 family)